MLSPAVLHDADHLNRMRRVVSGREVPADRILIRPVPPGHFFHVHDCHVLRSPVVGIEKIAPANQRYPHSSEIFPRNCVVAGERSLLAGRSLITLDLQFVSVVIVTHGNGGCETGGFNGRQRARPLKNLFKKLTCLGFLITGVCGRNGQIQNMIRIEPQIGMFDRSQAPHRTIPR